MVTDDEIAKALRISGLTGYNNTFAALGGGELNDTYIFECQDQKYIFRIAKDSDQNTLIREAAALRLLKSDHAPTLIFFDENQRINDRLWIIESYVSGKNVTRLSTKQFAELGSVLADIHKVTNARHTKLNLWQQFLEACSAFGDEKKFLAYPDPRLRQLILHAQQVMLDGQSWAEEVETTLVHGDATPSNILIDRDQVNLIDWELARFTDPMREFSTIYYEDMEYNHGKWRLWIQPEEKQALFRGYQKAGGRLDERRIAFWMIFDKLGAAVFLWWRINESGRQAGSQQLEQYRLDLTALLASLERNFYRAAK